MAAREALAVMGVIVELVQHRQTVIIAIRETAEMVRLLSTTKNGD